MAKQSALLTNILLALLVVSAVSTAMPNYVASVIEFGEEFQNFSVADVNGDGLNDVVVSNWNDGQGRELWIFWQQDDGKFPAQASRRIEIKRDIVAYALADIRAEPGEEFLFFTATSIFSYSGNYDGYANNLEKFVNWPLINAVPSRRTLHFLGRFSDHDGDGNINILVPGPEHYGLIRASVANIDKQLSLAPVAIPEAEKQQQTDRGEGSMRISIRDGFKIEVSRPSNFKDLIVERLVEDDNNSGNGDQSTQPSGLKNLLSLERWINNVQPAQLIPGAAEEYIFIDEAAKDNNKDGESQRVNIVSILDNGQATVAFQATIAKKDQLKLFDFNNDGLMDLLGTRVAGSDNVTANIYVNRRGEFHFDSPDHVIKFTGFDVSFRLSDVNGDNTPDLIVGSYQISALNALRDGALVRLSLIYAGNPSFADSSDNTQTLFNRRPSFKLEENFSADDIKGLTEAVDFSLDIDGDGNNEAVSVNKQGALSAKTLNRQFHLEDDTLWEFVPLHFIQEVENSILNQDGRPDFVVRHQNALTLLVSQ